MKPGSPRWWRELGIEPPDRAGDPDGAEGAPALAPAAIAGRRPTRVEASPAVVPAAPLPRSPAPAGRPRLQAARAGATPSDPARGVAIAGLAWDAFDAAVDACEACALRAGRKRSVPGVGDRRARWLFVGEGPGAEEDLRGEPFVGAAGQLLDNMLLALGLSRAAEVYIANVVKCRPPGNRTPEAAECAACLPFLERQIALIEPAMIVALGRVAAQTLLATSVNVGSLRGKVHDRGGIPLVVTYHPAYLLRSLPEKSRAWADLCLAQRALAERAGR